MTVRKAVGAIGSHLVIIGGPLAVTLVGFILLKPGTAICRSRVYAFRYIVSTQMAHKLARGTLGRAVTSLAVVVECLFETNPVHLFHGGVHKT